MAHSNLHIAVVGAGRIGKIHAQNLAGRIPGVRLALVADVNCAVGESLAAQLGVPFAQDYRAALEQQDIHAVAICSATNTHAEIIATAAAAGKHVFCEKPLDVSLERIDQSIAACERAGVILQVGFNRRFDPSFGRVRAAVADGEIGRPEILRITSRDPAPPPLDYIRGSGGIFLDMTIHDFDMARFLIGCEVEEVFAIGASLVDAEIGAAGDIDTALVTLRFAGGALGAIDNSRRAAYGYDQRAEVLGSLGAAQSDNHYPNAAIVSTAQCVRRDLPLHFFLERYAESFRAELAAFVASVRDGTPPQVTGADGRAATQLALAAGRSLAERRPVRVAEIG
jgi:myo-inositol 2-dehydrogenase/D-chiro-inositol 1-dehydrogenase